MVIVYHKMENYSRLVMIRSLQYNGRTTKQGGRMMSTSIFQDTMVMDNWKDVEKAGNENRKILFPIGVIEEHGPHISLGSDILWSCAICRMVKEKLKEYGCESVI